jgi:hypothetical protein
LHADSLASVRATSPFGDSAGKYVRTFNSIVRTAGTTDNTTDTGQATWSITVRAMRYPEFDCSSVQESWYRLSLAQLMHTGKDSFSISPFQYRSNKFIGAMNLEKALGQAGHTGVNTRSGSQLTLNFRGLPTSINTIHVVLHYEVACNVSAAGIEVLDSRIKGDSELRSHAADSRSDGGGHTRWHIQPYARPSGT